MDMLRPQGRSAPDVFEKQQGDHYVRNALCDGKREAAEANLCGALQSVLRIWLFLWVRQKTTEKD